MLKFIIAAALATTALSANAALSYGNNADAGAYVGVKAGQAKISKAAHNIKFKNGTAYGVYGGYNFNKNLGAEAEFLTTRDIKTNHGNDVNGNNVNSKLNIKTLGAYGTYRYHFNEAPVYVKGKLGVAHNKVDGKVDVGTQNVYKNKDKGKTNLGVGAAVGYEHGPVGAELGYTRLAGDYGVLSLGAHLNF